MSHTPTTGAVVRCEEFRFENEVGAEDPEVIHMSAQAIFNGPSPPAGIPVHFPRNASMATKTAAVRTAINEHIQAYGPGVPLLTNVAIQISGLPV